MFPTDRKRPLRINLADYLCQRRKRSPATFVGDLRAVLPSRAIQIVVTANPLAFSWPSRQP